MKNKNAAGIMLGSMTVLALMPTLTNAAYYVQGDMMDRYGYGSGFEGGHFIMMIFTFLLVVFGVVALLRYARGEHYHHDGSHGNTSDNALEILKARYAKGEIEKEEFESKKKDLTR